MRGTFPYMGWYRLLFATAVLFLVWGVQIHIDKQGTKLRFSESSLVIAEALPETAGVIDSIHVVEANNGNILSIHGSKPFTYTAAKLSNPLRIVLDIPDFVAEHGLTPSPYESGVIGTITTRAIEERDEAFCRIEIELKQDVPYEVKAESQELQIRCENPPAVLQAAHEGEVAKVSEEKVKKPDLKKILKVSLSQDQCGLRILSDSEMGNYTSFVLKNPPRLVVDVAGADYRLVENLPSIRTSVVEKVNVGIHPDKIRFVVHFLEQVPRYTVTQEGTALNISWEAPPPPEAEALVATPLNPGGEGNKQSENSPGTSFEKPLFIAEEEELQEETKAYSGQKISLDFKDADIRNILRLIADVSGLNIIVSENVKGKVTIKLEEIPWDQVLDIILETNNLGRVWMGNVVRIETQAEIKRISDEKYSAQKSRERVADLKTEVIDVIYRDAKDIADLLMKEKELTSDRGALSVDPNLNRIVITDTPEKVEKIREKIARYDDTTVRQVYIEAKIVQSIPTFTKEIGIQWGGPYVASGHGGKEIYAVGGAKGVTFDKEEVTDPVTGLTTEVLKKVISNGNVIDLPAAAGPGIGGGIGFGILRRNLELTATLTAMEKQEKLKIISNPRVLSIDKNEALIKQGVALPYLKLSEEGVTSTEFKDAVLELKVTQNILSPKIIKVEIKVKKDQKSAQTGAGGEPGIDVRETQTVLMVESGRTVVIGGIYEETTSTIRSGVPFFSTIPAFGRLFRNDYNKKELTELLIFLTTTIVPKEIIGADV